MLIKYTLQLDFVVSHVFLWIVMEKTFGGEKEFELKIW
jgi:hypothetical protein